jgi:hypothetical protein
VAQNNVIIFVWLRVNGIKLQERAKMVARKFYNAVLIAGVQNARH